MINIARTEAMTNRRSGLAASVSRHTKHSKKFKPVQPKNPPLTKHHHFTSRLSRSTSNRCRATASYPGDATTISSKAPVTFGC